MVKGKTRTGSGDPPGDGTLSEGRVLRVSARHALVHGSAGTVRCTLRKGLFYREAGYRSPLAAGDRVKLRTFERGDGVVEEILPRRGHLSRLHGPTGREQVMVANVDQVLVTMSLAEPPPRPRLIDRILVAAGRGRFDAALVFTKADLVEDPGASGEVAQIYRDLGYAVVVASAVTGQGIDEVRSLLRGRVTVLAGQSGVGKSTLLNAIQPGLGIKVAEISRKRGKGRHTTTAATLHPLDGGGWVADTPGVRSFAIAGLAPPDVAIFFRDFEPFIDGCRFPSCTHDHEPDCAVKAAVEERRVHPSRYESYLRILHGMEEDE